MDNTAHVPGLVIWITGFSGAGKSTVAHLLAQQFVASGVRPVVLDGDAMRAVFAREGVHTRRARLELAWIYARLCREIAGQGIPVICATISMFHEVRAWSRANTTSYYEVYLRVPTDQRVARDPKGLYAAAADKKAGPMVGLDKRAEEPLSPDLVINNWGGVNAQQASDAIWRQIVPRVKIYEGSREETG